MKNLEEIELEILNTSICLAFYENKIDLSLITDKVSKLGDILDKLDPLVCLNVTNSIYYHYTNFKNQLIKVLKKDLIAYDIQKLEQSVYLDCINKLQRKVIH
ncbi:hypothetical protein SGLAD_v1c07610 [Spiroplasma gladiatoris]|uniref:Uncharacterized protein n=1 Tax=Spiroplasma gladiatoris TaxID=2143 RepID=A0A4P7AK76_9MOLU|nr:hypothetical protein [Spiroplasma gladiatoris]QBQ07960.1 hypothetical protein SGLAD_v1c07610 [Spiroplasma gladiatoris]